MVISTDQFIANPGGTTEQVVTAAEIAAFVGTNTVQQSSVFTTPSITANVLTLNLALGPVFQVTNNANITTFTISNPSSGRYNWLRLILVGDGTPRTQAWGASVSWLQGQAPTLISTLNARNVIDFYTVDNGTTYYGVYYQAELIPAQRTTITATGVTAYPIPAGATRIEGWLWGGGGGGGSGRRGAAGSARSGGIGGAGSEPTFFSFLVSELGGTSINVTVGAGGGAGAAITVDDTSGNQGSAGSDTTFGTLARARGGIGGVEIGRAHV